MITIRLRGYPTGETLYVFPETKDVTSASDWADFKVLMVEADGRYTASVDTANGTNWVAFVGATQPGGWDDAIADIGWDLEVLLIPRAASAVTAGAAQQKHLENSLGATLQTVYEVLDGDVA